MTLLLVAIGHATWRRDSKYKGGTEVVLSHKSYMLILRKKKRASPIEFVLDLKFQPLMNCSRMGWKRIVNKYVGE